MVHDYRDTMIKLAEEVFATRQMLRFVGRGPDFDPPDRGATWSEMILTVGHGYFSGSMLTVVGNRQDGSRAWGEAYELSVPDGVDAFLNARIPPHPPTA